jgi:hypothetical protein
MPSLLGIAFMMAFAYAVVYLPIMWPARPADWGEWVAVYAPLPSIVAALLIGMWS